MNSVTTILVTLVVGAVLGAAAVLALRARPGNPLPSHRSAGPTLEQIRKLASLVTLHVPISDVQVSRVSGRAGSTSLILVIKGDVEIGADLTQARFDLVNEESRTATICLPSPELSRPRLDHDRTHIYRIDRSGLWRLYPGQAAERELINSALKQAQHLLSDAAEQAELIGESRQLVEQVVRGLFEAVGWCVEIRWHGGQPRE